MPYDFKAARDRQKELINMYRTLNHIKNQDGTWDWWIRAEIAEIDQEINQVHESQNGRMTTVTSSGHPIVQISNTFIPIVPQWAMANKENLNESNWNCT